MKPIHTGKYPSEVTCSRELDLFGSPEHTDFLLEQKGWNSPACGQLTPARAYDWLSSCISWSPTILTPFPPLSLVERPKFVVFPLYKLCFYSLTPHFLSWAHSEHIFFCLFPREKLPKKQRQTRLAPHRVLCTLRQAGSLREATSVLGCISCARLSRYRGSLTLRF